MNKYMTKKTLSIAITLVFFLLFIYYFLNEPSFINILKNTRLSFLLAIISFCFLRMIILSLLNIFLYRFINLELSFYESFRIVFINRAGNQLLPLKFGSGYKLHYFVNKLKTPISTYMSINTGHALINLVINSLILFFVVNIYSDIYSQEILNFINVFLISFVTFFLLIFFISLKVNNLKNNFLSKVQDGFKSLLIFNKNQLSFLITLICLAILNIFITFYIADLYVLNNSFWEATKFYTVGQFTGIVTLTPGNIGVSEVILITLQSLFIYKTSEILVISLVGRIADFLLLLFLNFFIKKAD